MLRTFSGYGRHVRRPLATLNVQRQPLSPVFQGRASSKSTFLESVALGRNTVALSEYPAKRAEAFKPHRVAYIRHRGVGASQESRRSFEPPRHQEFVR